MGKTYGQKIGSEYIKYLKQLSTQLDVGGIAKRVMGSMESYPYAAANISKLSSEGNKSAKQVLNLVDFIFIHGHEIGISEHEADEFDYLYSTQGRKSEIVDAAMEVIENGLYELAASRDSEDSDW